jgi:hypothetical protein
VAKKISKNEATGIAPDELRGVLSKAQTEKAKAGEHTAEQSSIIRNAIEHYGLDRTALAMTRRLAGFEDSKRQATLRALLEYCAKMGFFDQTDAFDDMLDVVETAIRGDKPSRKKTRPALDAVATAIVN